MNDWFKILATVFSAVGSNDTEVFLRATARSAKQTWQSTWEVDLRST